jgi:DNA mismatch repair ATPase MutL
LVCFSKPDKTSQSKQTQQYNKTGQNKPIHVDTAIQRNEKKQTDPNRHSNTTKPDKTNQSKQTQQYNKTGQNKPIQTDTAIQPNQTKRTNPNRDSNTTKPDKTNQVSVWFGLVWFVLSGFVVLLCLLGLVCFVWFRFIAVSTWIGLFCPVLLYCCVCLDWLVLSGFEKQTNPNRHSITTKPGKTKQSKQKQQYNEPRQNNNTQPKHLNSRMQSNTVYRKQTLQFLNTNINLVIMSNLFYLVLLFQ